MGGSTFCIYRAGTNRKEVFSEAVKDAKHEHGHGGYSGSIAEKRDCVFITSVKTKDEAFKMADRLIDDGDSRIDDKHGPAGAIAVEEPPGFVFFGWASS